MTSLKSRYDKDVRDKLAKELGVDNKMRLPRLKKTVVNVGIPKTDNSPTLIKTVVDELSAITGQAPQITTAKKAIAGFKIREGDPVGVSVTLRGDKMLDFLDKLARIILPQVKDFKGISRKSFDGQGNYNLGLSEQIIFPEIDYSKVTYVHGLEITIVTTATNDEEALRLLTLIGLPFEKE